MSVPLNFISAFNPFDHEPIQKRTSARRMIKFWFPPDLRQIIEYQANIYPKRSMLFYISIRNTKTKQTLKSDWKNLISPSNQTLTIQLEQLSLQENARLMPRNTFDHTHFDDCMKMHFLDQTRLSAVWIKILASEAGAVSAADPPGCHGLTCPRALAHRYLSPIFPDTAMESGKHFQCNDHCQTVCFRKPKSVIRTKWQAVFQLLESDWNSRTQHNDNYVRTI